MVSRLILYSRARAGLLLPGRGPPPKLAGRFGGQRRFAAGVGAALFGGGDALALAFEDQRPFEFGERAHHRQHEVGHGGVLAGEDETLFDELDAGAAAGEGADEPAQVAEVCGRAGSASAPGRCRRRQREGIAAAKQRGVYTGRRPAFTAEQAQQLLERVANGEMKSALAKEFGISRETVYSYLRPTAVASRQDRSDVANDATGSPSGSLPLYLVGHRGLRTTNWNNHDAR
jgi:hypothetical protein